MSLVADYGSESESEDTEPIQQPTSSKPSFSSLLPPPKTVTPTPSKPTSSSFSSLLPPPKSVPVSTSPHTATKSPSTTISSDVTPTKTKRIQIFVDLPKPSANPDSDTEDADDRDAKKPRLGTGGSGLTALLPAPKNTRPHVPSVKGSLGAGTVGGGFVPYALTKKREGGAAKAKSGIVVKKEEVKIVAAKVEEEKVDEVAAEDEAENEDEEEVTDSATGSGIVKSFFPLGLSLTAAPPVDLPIDDPAPTPTPHSTQLAESAKYAYTAADAYSYDPNAAYAYGADPAVYQQYYYDTTTYAEEADDAATAQGEGSAGIADEVLAKLGGFRRGETQAFEIKDINQSEQIQRDAWAPSASAAPVSSGSSGMKVSGMQKRKHNIMYLAAQAKDMEQKLMDSFANNRKTKRETQSKYGF